MPDDDLALYRNQVTIGDSIALMEKLPAGSVDVVFADPPYNLQLQGALAASRPKRCRCG
jgi:modification methylase